MTSSDSEFIRSEIRGLKVYIDGRILEFENKLDARTNELKDQIREVKTELRVNAVKTEELKSSVKWHFTTLAIVVGIVGFAITLAPMFREIFRDKKKYTTPDDVRGIIREEINKLKGSTE